MAETGRSRDHVELIDTTRHFAPELDEGQDPLLLHAGLIRTPLESILFEPDEGEEGEPEDVPEESPRYGEPGSCYAFSPPTFEVHPRPGGVVTITCQLAPCGLLVESGGLMASGLEGFGRYRHSVISPSLHEVQADHADEAIRWWTRLILRHGEPLDDFSGWVTAAEALRRRMRAELAGDAL